MTTDLTIAPEALTATTATTATDVLAERLFSSLLGTLDVLTVHIGDLSLDAPAARGPHKSAGHAAVVVLLTEWTQFRTDVHLGRCVSRSS